MRRQDRAVTRPEKVKAIIAACDVCRLALSVDDKPYLVPMNFGYELGEGKVTLYFHCAREGKRLTMMEKNPRVCFEMDCAHRMITGEIPCESSMDYASVIGYGLLEKVEDDEEKRRGLALILQNCRMNFPPEMIDRMPLGAVTVLKLCSNDFTAKQRGVAF